MGEKISVIVLCYHKFEFIYKALDSVLEQKYPMIELVISDDASPNFPEKEIEDYIVKKKNINIVNVVINHETVNLGTVKHLNHAIELSSGDYIVALAADDVFYDENVLENYVKGFDKAGSECYIEMAQTAMCDYDMNVQGYYLQSNVKEVLEKKDCGKELFGLLAFKPYLPSTSTCFTRKFFELYGKFDENYKLIEDVPMHLRLAREGWQIHYENFVAVKHRTGGISHGNIGGLTKTQKMYYQDILYLFEHEVVPYYDLIEPSMRKNVKRITNINRIWYVMKLGEENVRSLKWKLLRKYPSYYLKHILLGKSYIFSRRSSELFKLSWFLIVASPMIKYLMSDIAYTDVILTGTVIIMFIIALILKILGFLGKSIAKIEYFSDHFLAIG